MASFTAGTTFVDGVSNDVTAAKLGALVTNATPTSGFIQDRTAETVTATNDTLLIGDASDSNNLKRITVANFAQTLPTAKVTTGTIETGTFGTTTSTAATITTGTIETGTFGTTTSTAQIVTSGTFLGAITGSTNVINIGSGQIYKDASGNVGVGVTPSGWGASEYKAIQVGIGGSISGRVSGGDQDKVNVAANVYHDGTNFRYMASDESTIYQQTGGIHIFSNAPSGTAGSTATFTERLRIDSSGNVGIGVTPSSGYRFTSKGETATSAGYNLLCQNSSGSTCLLTRDDGLITTGLLANSPFNYTTGGAANAAIFSDGNLGRSTSSIKYKKDVVNTNHGLLDVMKLRPVTYRGKSENDGNTVFGGLIAEEVHDAGLTEFVQYADDGTPDALSYGNMVSLAFKAIQEQQAIIEELKNKVAALEAA